MMWRCDSLARNKRGARSLRQFNDKVVTGFPSETREMARKMFGAKKRKLSANRLLVWDLPSGVEMLESME